MKQNKAAYILIFALFIVYVTLIVIAFWNLDRFTAAVSKNSFRETIVLDAGHGGEDGGAVANDIIEKDINLSITNKLADLFGNAGFNVVMTRSRDEMLNPEGETLRERKVSDMKNRLALYNSDENNTVISIHQNKFPQEKYYGAQVFYSANNPDSAILAESVRNNITALTQPDNTRECKAATKDIYLLSNSTVPSIIVECGFISNYNEAQLLKSDDYQMKLAFSIFTGYLNYRSTR